MVLFAFLICSCSKKDTTVAVSTGQLYLHLHTNIDTTEMDSYKSIIRSSSGRKISLSLAQLYISQIVLVKLDGSLLPVTGKVLLKTFENEAFLVGDVPVGNYKSIRFCVGLDAATNAQSPISTDSVFYRPEMWFGATAQPFGFVSMNVEGTIDTTATANGTINQMVPFSYKIGTSTNIISITFPDISFSVITKQDQYIHIIINYMNIFKGIDLSKSGNLMVLTSSDNTSAIAKQIVSSIPSMFSFE
jgi:hypothetical protein